MKNLKVYLVVIIIILLFGSLFFINFKKIVHESESKLFSNISYKDNDKSNLTLYLELKDRYIYTYGNVDMLQFTYKNKTKELKTWFLENENFLDTFINEVKNNSDDEKTNSYDGGSEEFYDGDIGVVFCNTYDQNINIVIGENLDFKKANCSSGKKMLVSKKLENDSVVNIVDKSKYYGDIPIICDDTENSVFEDDNYIYDFSCQALDVVYESGFDEPIKMALQKGHIDIKDLDKYNIKYTKK